MKAISFWVLALLIASAARAADETPSAKPLEYAEAVAALKTSSDRDKLYEAAVSLCRSKEPKALEILVELLLDPAFRARLDSEKEPCTTWVTEAIGKIGTAKAEDAILRLSNNKQFRDSNRGLAGLIKAAMWIQKPSPKLVAFVESTPALEYGTLNGATEVLTKMGTPEACAALARLVEPVLMSPDYDKHKKRYRLLYDLLPVRNDLAIVKLYERLFAAKELLKDEFVRNIMVQSLFDYRPQEWAVWDPDYDAEPPVRKNAPTEVLEKHRALADAALKMDLAKDTKAGVEKAKKEIETLLAERKSKK
jgi:hypothetical protein